MEQELINALSDLKEVLSKFNSHKIGQYEVCEISSKVFKDLESKGIKIDNGIK